MWIGTVIVPMKNNLNMEPLIILSDRLSFFSLIEHFALFSLHYILIYLEAINRY
jgi:hypothetical protein